MTILHNLKRLIFVLLLSLGGEAAWADYQLNLPVGVTETSRTVYGFHMFALWICVAIGVVVFGVMFWSIYHHRKSRNPVPATFHENAKLEFIWTIIPVFILIALAVPATTALIKIEDTSNADMTIKVTGYQWKWHYDYLDNGIKFFSSLDEKSNRARQLGSGVDPTTIKNYLLEVDNPLVIPTNKKVRFLFTAADVIHAWWVPDFGWKKDAIPGFVTAGWVKVDKPGIYRGQCAELCGRDHGFMPIVVKAVPQEEYEAWVAQWKQEHESAPGGAQEGEWTMEQLMARGKEVYNTHCVSCHQADGSGIPGTFPAIAGSEIAKGDIDTHIEIVLEGKGAMPGYGQDKNISDEDLAAVITYERNAFGNDTGDMVKPEDIADVR